MRTPRQLLFSSEKGQKLTHCLFRYPAKFHPPVIRSLLERYSNPGDVVLDPFCGSGTLLVEAGVMGRHAVGTDVDPLAVWITRVKTAPYRPASLLKDSERLIAPLDRLARGAAPWRDSKLLDIDEAGMAQVLRKESLWLPKIPNITHWFRRGVLLDLARLRRHIEEAKLPAKHRQFALLCFASIIRGASNADPTPVSGLEVTAHMRRLEAKGRRVDVYAAYKKAVAEGCRAVDAWSSARAPTSRIRTRVADVRDLTRTMRCAPDVVITSPPYFSAVDYYRRHTLEMYWLGLSEDEKDRQTLKKQYIGRYKVYDKAIESSSLAPEFRLTCSWLGRFNEASESKARDFLHYASAMRSALAQISRILLSGCPLVLVIGNSRWRGVEVPTRDIIIELGSPEFKLKELWQYPIRNRYMSYQRKNSADIDKEYACVFVRK